MMSWEEVQVAPVLLLAHADTMRGEASYSVPRQPAHSIHMSSDSLSALVLFRLVLPFERHIKGEEDKPLPPSKPRKPYKRNLDGKVNKAEVKRKRTHSDREMDSEVTYQLESLMKKDKFSSITGVCGIFLKCPCVIL